MAERRERADSRLNRERILAATVDLLRRTPDASVADIARAAGVTRVTVYRHFDDRDALLGAVAVELAAELVPRVLAELAERPLGDAMEHLARTVTTLGAEHRHLLAATSQHLEELARLAVTDDPIARHFAWRRETGELTSDLSDAWLAACVRSLCLLAVDRPGDPVATGDDLAAVLRRLVA